MCSGCSGSYEDPDMTAPEAEEFRAKHGLSPDIPASEISEVMILAELDELPTRCTPCYEGEHSHCWGDPCECCGPTAERKRAVGKLMTALQWIRTCADRMAE